MRCAALITVLYVSCQGAVRMTTNHHLTKYVNIGRLNLQGQFDLVLSTRDPVTPQPWSQWDDGTIGKVGAARGRVWFLLCCWLLPFPSAVSALFCSWLLMSSCAVLRVLCYTGVRLERSGQGASVHH